MYRLHDFVDNLQQQWSSVIKISMFLYVWISVDARIAVYFPSVQQSQLLFCQQQMKVAYILLKKNQNKDC